MSNLYLVDGEGEDGYKCSLLINASSPQEAFDLWKASDVGAMAEDGFSDRLSSLPPEDALPEDLRIFIVPKIDEVGVLGWHKVDGVKLVAFAAAS